jgi:hypothetical protein
MLRNAWRFRGPLGPRRVQSYSHYSGILKRWRPLLNIGQASGQGGDSRYETEQPRPYRPHETLRKPCTSKVLRRD